MVVFYYFLKLFIIIFRKPLLIAILRLIDISFLPKKINISCASDDNSKYRLISKVRLRTLYKQSKFNKTQFVCPTDSFSLFPTEFLPDIVFKSNILYTPLRSKMKSAVRIPLGLGRIYTQQPWSTALRAALSHSLLLESRILRYVLQSSYDLFDRKDTTSFWNYQTLGAKCYCPSEQRPCRDGSLWFPRQDHDRKPVRQR